MTHKNYFKISAKNNYELGLKLGETFKENLLISLEKVRSKPNWKEKIEISKKYLPFTEKVFPQYIEETKGYAISAGVDFYEVWARGLEDEFNYYKEEKCTTVVTNNGKFISHNEDWDKDSKDNICILEKTVGEVTIFELFYHNTLGGNSISVNSYGIIQSINSLNHSDWQMGIPRNVVARFMSETADPELDFEKLKSMERSTGYNHVLVNNTGNIWNIECSSKQEEITKPTSPFVHTNHYLYSLRNLEVKSEEGSTFNRYDMARKNVKDQMTTEELIKLTGNQSDGKQISIFNERTIGRVVLDAKNKLAKIWLLREEELGWIDYELSHLFE